jgi:hypothetical protein
MGETVDDVIEHAEAFVAIARVIKKTTRWVADFPASCFGEESRDSSP